MCPYSFHSRKYGDKFAEKLSSVLPKFTSLRKLEYVLYRYFIPAKNILKVIVP